MIVLYIEARNSADQLSIITMASLAQICCSNSIRELVGLAAIDLIG
jgi:hypothetical protein